MGTLRLVGLVRVSSEGQVGEDGEGLDRQRAAVQRIAQAHGATLRIVEIHAVSGPYVADTPEWTGVVRPLINQGWHLAVDAVDRLIRADSFDFRVLQDLKRAGALIYTPSGVQDLNRAGDTLLATILAALGGFERSEIERRMRDGRLAARQRGEWAVGRHLLPTGCTYDMDARRWGVEPDGAAKVRAAFEAVAAGQSVLGTARNLGVDTKVVHGWIRHPIYRGYLRDTIGDIKLDGEVQVYGGKDQEAPIVSEATWRTANARLDANATTHRRRRDKVAPTVWASTYLYSGHSEWRPLSPGLEESTTGHRHVVYGRSPKHDHATITYQCACLLPTSWAAGKDQCGLRPMKAERVNMALDAYLTALTHDPSILEDIKASLTVQGTDPEVERTRIRKALHKLDTKEERLVEIRLEGQYSKAVLDKQAAKIREERERLERALAALDAPSGPTAADVDRMAEGWGWDATWEPARKREWLAAHVPGGVTITNEGIESIGLRVPCEGGEHTYHGGPARTWESLIGITARASVIGPKQWPAGTCGTSEAAKRLGVKATNLAKWANNGTVPQPALRSQRHLAWTEADIAAARTALQSRTA